MKTSTLKPGLLVSLRTSVRGGVDYQRIDLESDHATETGEHVAKWETVRTIPDAQEYERAQKARSKASGIIRAQCAKSAFGLLCPSERSDALSEAIAQAHATCDLFNETSGLCKIEVFALVGKVASDEVEAIRAISAEVRELLQDMETGIKRADPEAIRNAANKARDLGAMLSDDVAKQVNEAIGEARKAAREIVKRVETGAESAADVVKDLSVAKINTARFSFLDLEQNENVTPVEVQGRNVDLESLDFSALSVLPNGYITKQLPETV